MEAGNNQSLENNLEPAQVLALERCDTLVTWYQKNLNKQRLYMSTSRLIAVVLGGLVPVLVIIQMSLKAQTTWWLLMSILIALFPATAAIISSLNEMFVYKENWLRFSIASEELKSERMKYLTRTTRAYRREIDDYEALSNFVSRIEAITLRETRKWQGEVEQSRELDEVLKSVGQKSD